MPDIRILKPGDEQSLETFLMPRVASSMFLIGNSRMAGLEDHGETYQGTYAAAFEDGRITAIAAHYWNQILVLQATDHIKELVQTVLSFSERPLKGLVGPADHVGRAKEFLGMSETDIQNNGMEYLYSLNLDAMKVPGILASGKVHGRLIQAGDIEMVAEWEAAYMQEELGEVDSPDFRKQCRETVQRSEKEQRAWILEHRGRAVARTGFNAVIKEAVQVGGVWTPPEWRSRGYARAVVAHSLLDARRKGIPKAILFTGSKNYPARKAYESLGFRHIGHYRLLFLKSPVKKYQ